MDRVHIIPFQPWTLAEDARLFQVMDLRICSPNQVASMFPQKTLLAIRDRWNILKRVAHVRGSPPEAVKRLDASVAAHRDPPVFNFSPFLITRR
jgi:hypothetical protein